MKRKFTFLIAAMALMIAIIVPGAKAWGQTTVTQTSFSATSGILNSDANVTYTSYKGGASTAPGNYNNGIRLYQGSSTSVGGYIVLGVPSGYKITSASITSTGTYETTTGYYLSETAPTTTPDKSDFAVSNYSLPKNSTYTVNSISTRYITFGCFGTSKSTRLEIGTISITYVADGPTCTIDPTSYDFGDITVGQNGSHDFTATTANLTGDLTVTASDGFTVTPATIASTATSTTLSVTCTPTVVGDMNGTLTISGGGLAADVTATLSATGLCVEPTTSLSYTTPVVLTLTGDDVSTTLTPTENTGNGGTINYALVEGDENNAAVDNTGYFYATAIGTYTVRATQDLNGTTCGGTFDIVINVTGTSPTCTIDPTEWDFGNVGVGASANKTFIVTTANLTGDLTLSMLNGTDFSVSPATIEQGATATEITVTCTPTAAVELEDLLTISGGGLSDEVDVQLNATGFLQYTVTYSAVNGTVPAAQTVAQGSAVTLGTVTDVDCSVWSFAGWSETESSTTEPTLLAGGEYTPEGNVTLYAVYRRAASTETVDYTLAYDTWTYSGTTTKKPITVYLAPMLTLNQMKATI